MAQSVQLKADPVNQPVRSVHCRSLQTDTDHVVLRSILWPHVAQGGAVCWCNGTTMGTTEREASEGAEGGFLERPWV